MTPRAETVKPRRTKAALALVAWIALCLAVGAFSSLFSAPEIPTWYAGLARPVLTPPNAVFAPVWITLYVLMAVSAWLVWKTRPSGCRRNGLRLFCVQLWFNLLWAWIFFSRHQIGTALIDLVVLWIAIALTISNFRKVSHAAAWLMVPYLAWVAFAAYLNFRFWQLN